VAAKLDAMAGFLGLRRRLVPERRVVVIDLATMTFGG
jgi:hypothetical protein